MNSPEAPYEPRAKLLARVGEEFPWACPSCGGDIRLIAWTNRRRAAGSSLPWPPFQRPSRRSPMRGYTREPSSPRLVWRMYEDILVYLRHAADR
jgi:hypothetical protein